MANFFQKIKLNDFALQFSNARDQDELINKLQMIKNSQGVSKEEYDLQNNPYGVAAEDDANYIDFMPVFETKRARVSKYREMSLYPEVKEALENHVNDSIVDNGDGKVVELDIKGKMPVNVKKRIEAAFNYYINEVLKFNDKGDDYFKKWLTEGELYAEQITNDKGDNIIGIKILPCFTMAPIYKKGALAGYTQHFDNVAFRNFKVKDEDRTDFEPNQIAYVNYGDFGENEYDVRGFLESSVKTYNMLKSLEDSIVIYRLSRSTERRVWNIYTGRMPKGKAEEFVKQVMKKYKTKTLYDPNTGSIDSAQNIQTISHDIWISKSDQGDGTTVDTIGGGMNLGEIRDLDWFKEKLYKGLKLPTSRWNVEQKQQPYSSGKMGEVAREEINYARFIERLQRKFKPFILNPFLTLLRMRGIDEEYLKRENLDIKFVKSNLFKEYKEIELREARLGTLSSIAGYIISRDNMNQPEGLFSKEFVLKHYFKMTNEEWEENERLKKKELEGAEELSLLYPPINPFDVDQNGVDDGQEVNQDVSQEIAPEQTEIDNAEQDQKQ